MDEIENKERYSDPKDTHKMEKLATATPSISHPDINQEKDDTIAIDLSDNTEDRPMVSKTQEKISDIEANLQNEEDSLDVPLVVEQSKEESRASSPTSIDDASQEKETLLKVNSPSSQTTSVVENGKSSSENINFKNPESFSMFKTDKQQSSELETDLVTDTLQNTVKEISKDIAQTVVDETVPSRNIETIDENAMDVPTPCTSMPGTPAPGTPCNKALLRVASEADISNIGDDSNISFVSETSRDDETNDTTAGQVATPKEVKKKPPKRRGDLSMLALNGSDMHDFGADKLYEYKWPQDGKGDYYMLQEQVSDFLGVLSFKRKYPDLERRAIEPNERVYLREKGLVTEMQCDLGLTAIRSDLVHDLMAKDYPDKYKEFLIVLKERRKQQAIEKQKELLLQKNDKTKLEAVRKKALKSAADFNSMFNKERREDRRAFFDIHSFEIQYPKSRYKVLPKEMTKVGAYPVAVIPGQFQDYYKRYKPDELRYMPINTALYSSPRKMPNVFADPPPLSDQESDAESVSTEASDVSETAGSVSEEMGSDIFREDELEDDEDAGSQGKTKEEKKAEIDNKVQTILEKMKEKEETPRRRGGAGKNSGTSTPIEQTPGEGGRRRKRRGEDSPAVKDESTPKRTPKRQRKVKVPESECSICNGTELINPSGQRESLVQCAQCKRHGHPSCLELTAEMIPIIRTYAWQCMECKSCVKCADPQHEDKMLFCDHCDRGYHTFCVGLAVIPNGRWECPSCRPRQVVMELPDAPLPPVSGSAQAAGAVVPATSHVTPSGHALPGQHVAPPSNAMPGQLVAPAGHRMPGLSQVAPPGNAVSGSSHVAPAIPGPQVAPPRGHAMPGASHLPPPEGHVLPGLSHVAPPDNRLPYSAGPPFTVPVSAPSLPGQR